VTASRQKPRPQQRRWARRLATQALYQWQLDHQDIGQVNAQFLTERDMGAADLAYFQELLQQTVHHVDAIEAVVTPYLDRPMAQIDPVERAILWIGGYELLYRADVPYRVIINEAVELAKTFGAEQGHRFVNGVLDKIAQQVRSEEISARRR
jgi:N utilization substance protein B